MSTTPRNKRLSNASDGNSTIDSVAGEVVTRVSDRGAPAYLRSAPDPLAPAPVYQQQIANTAALPAAPGASTQGVPMPWASDVVLYWKNVTATHTSIDVAVWAWADTGEWVRVGILATVLPLTEVKIPGLGYRRCYVQIVAANGGAAGSIVVNATGV